MIFVLLYSSNNKKRRKSKPIKMSKSSNQLSHTLYSPLYPLIRNSALYKQLLRFLGYDM